MTRSAALYGLPFNTPIKEKEPALGARLAGRVGKDALFAMGYARGNHTKALGKLDEKQKGLSSVQTLGGRRRRTS